MASMKCMKCSKKLEYVRELSAPRSNLRVYTCWECDLTYKVELKDHLAIVGIEKAK